MKSRILGNSRRSVSEIGLGCWQLGADWGEVSDREALEIMTAAVHGGITFFDTADVYGAGRSERLIGKFLRQHPESIFVATKVGRRNFPGPYSAEVLKQHLCESCERLGTDSLDLVQLHCIPGPVMAAGEVFDWLRTFKSQGLIKNFGASVESVQEALLILDQPELTSLQIIFNVFRQKPARELFDRARQLKVGLIVRLPLASGLLAGKFTSQTRFANNDHRHYNRNGDAFNVGETFAGLPFETGVDLADQVRAFVPPEMTMAQFAQRWILDHEAVTTVITGASNASQVADNVRVSALPRLNESLHQRLATFYDASVRANIRGVY
jgi:aryl-alcohol dehydrogenase-like predicted oxidoreductase